ncbi:unnamed protein product [Linum trigynum]|uniref:Uncharacterized protein n=1 Tax=Linum trigynum TaxID=586398 RepID=A0AAV2FAT9_9ROSI
MSELKNMVTTFVSTSIEKFVRMDQFMELSKGKFNALEAGQRNQSAILQDLQNQIRGITRHNNTRAPRTRLANTIPNPRKPRQYLDAITTRSGKTMSTIPAPARQEEPTPAPALPAEDEEVGIEKEGPTPKPQQVVKEHDKAPGGAFFNQNTQLKPLQRKNKTDGRILATIEVINRLIRELAK